MSTCPGEVTTVRGLTVMFTGKVTINGDQMYRPRLQERLEMLGGTISPHWSKKVNVLVHGDLTGQIVSDRRRLFSKKLLGVEEHLASGAHVHVIDSAGFAALLRGKSATCLTERLRPR